MKKAAAITIFDDKENKVPTLAANKLTLAKNAGLVTKKPVLRDSTNTKVEAAEDKMVKKSIVGQTAAKVFSNLTNFASGKTQAKKSGTTIAVPGLFKPASAQEQKNAPASAPVEDPMQIDAVSAVQDWDDIDEPDYDDPQACTEYVAEIMEYLRIKEAKFRVNSNYIMNQPDINAKMRAVLVDWLVEVHHSWKLMSETLFLASYLLDKFLSLKQVTRHKLQLVGVTALLIACKFEEIYPPEVRDLIYVTDNAYEREEILKMEWLIITTLNFDLSIPSSLHFLRRYSKAARSDSKAHTLSKYLLELCLVEYKMLAYLPSELAAASVLLTNRMLGKPGWTPTLQHYSGFTEENIIQCARDISQLHKQSMGEKNPFKSVTEKYVSSKLYEVAKLPAVDL